MAAVAEAYGVPAGQTQELANVLSGLDLDAIGPELALAVVEALAYIYALDEQAEKGPPSKAPGRRK